MEVQDDAEIEPVFEEEELCVEENIVLPSCEEVQLVQ